MKTLIILSGVSGSGKSTFAASFPEALICSADQYFTMTDGSYRFDPAKLSDAHGYCFRRAFAAVKDSTYETIIVDNTNLTSEEIAPYYAIAQAFGARCELHTFLADSEDAAKRNLHSVPSSKVREQSRRLLARRLPPFWSFAVRKTHKDGLALNEFTPGRFAMAE
jgi:predicted kinase